jgi:hypothetical protein
MPAEPIDADDPDCLQCGCSRDGALLEAWLVAQGIIGLDVQNDKGETGWKTLIRPAMEIFLNILEVVGLSLDDLLELSKEVE